MNELVFLEPNKIDSEPFTTSKAIAMGAGIRHDKIKATIEKHSQRINAFGKLTSYGGGLGGRGIESGYHLNEEQATFLVTLLKNTEPVLNLKQELVRQFYAMRSELSRRQLERIQLKPIRREMTDAIQQMDTDQWAYVKYTNLAYIAVTGKIARVLRKERNAPRDAKAIDYMTADEIHAITEMQYRIAVLVEAGLIYQQIKEVLMRRAAA